MQNTLRIGRIAGIPIHVHWTFALLVLWILLTSLTAGKSAEPVLAGPAFVLILFGCVLFHELGHALAARWFGIATRDITLLPIGGVARLERMPRKPAQEMVVALAGPAVNVAIAIALALLLAASTGVRSVLALQPSGGALLQQVMIANVFLVVFNLLPAFPMDGGRVFRAFLAMFVDYLPATRVAVTVGQALAIGIGALGFVNPMLFLVAAFVFFSASAELWQTEMQHYLGRWKARDAMFGDFRVVAASTPIADCAQSLLNNYQRDFPVVSDGELVGMISREQLVTASDDPGSATAGEVMNSNVVTIDVTAPLASALESATGLRNSAGQQVRTLPVMNRGALVGLLDIGHVVGLAQARDRLPSGPDSVRDLACRREKAASRTRPAVSDSREVTTRLAARTETKIAYPTAQ